MANNAPKNGHEKSPPPAVYFLSLTVNNFRAFGPEPVTLDLTDGHGNYAPWTILLGDNGTGKTTLLQLVAAIESAHEISRGENIFVNFSYPDTRKPASLREFWSDFIGKGEVASHIGLHMSDFQQFGFKFERHIPDDIEWVNYQNLYIGLKAIGGKWVENNEVVFLNAPIFGYGASRRMSRNAVADGLSREACQTLFDETTDLINAEDWLIRADYAVKLGQESGVYEPAMRLKRILEILMEVLPDVDEFEYGMISGGSLTPYIRAKTPSGWVRVANLSLGYKTTLAWIVDFAARMFDRYPKSENPLAEPAVCLVDEIDLHLHPRWQRKLIADLSKTFPKTQFIVTAHSPLIVQAAPDANLALLQWKDDHVVIDNDVDHIRKWRVDQILASELFGGQPVHAAEVETLLEQRTQILSKPRLTKRDNAELAKLNAQLKRLPAAALPDDPEAIDLIWETAELLRAKNGA